MTLMSSVPCLYVKTIKKNMGFRTNELITFGLGMSHHRYGPYKFAQMMILG